MCMQMATAVGLLCLLLFAQYSHVGPFGSLGDKATDLCKNPKDQAATGSQRGTLKESIRNCALQCSLTGYMQTCVVSLGFTPSCAICYVDLVSCTKKRCLLPCLYPSARLCNPTIRPWRSSVDKSKYPKYTAHTTLRHPNDCSTTQSASALVVVAELSGLCKGLLVGGG